MKRRLSTHSDSPSPGDVWDDIPTPPPLPSRSPSPNSVPPPPPILKGGRSAPRYIPIDRDTVPVPPAHYPDDVPEDWFPSRAWALTDFITRRAVEYYAANGEKIVEQYKAGRRVPMDDREMQYVRESGILKRGALEEFSAWLYLCCFYMIDTRSESQR
ncbi:hypothetical protein BDZ89DRAFT_1065397 [Hymenopellis radicata]|nr:hypothetical protein BDZ89DRAFT_1065397 [Hymenopellis radicata]